MGMNFIQKLPIPQEVKEKYPLSNDAAAKKAALDREIRDVLSGKSAKKLLIVGPCSADREDAVLEYCGRLALLQQRVADKLLFIARVYTNKPRTTGDGYKGMLHQPDPNEKPDPFRGILAIRELHTRVISEFSLPTADEILYPQNYRYVSDLLSYVTVGARSTENQEHRLVASGVEAPVGMKNPTSGDLGVMLNSVNAALHSHTFIYRGWEVVTDGNPYAHAILRGYVDKSGQTVPNYHYEELYRLCRMFSTLPIPYPAVIVDANHSNSGKNCDEQPRICSEVLSSCRINSDIARLVKGFMIESYLVDGAQEIDADDVYGKSITDPCLGWDKTERLILDIAERI